MTIAVGNIVMLTDHDSVEVSSARAHRIAMAMLGSILRHIPGVDPLAAEDAARNLAQAYGVLGILDDGPAVGSER